MTIKCKLILLSVLSIFLTNCNNIDKKNLEVIEGIQLGTTYEKYNTQIDSIGIDKKQYITKVFIDELSEMQNNLINVNVTDIFNLSNFRTNTNHYGILYPITRTGTNNVIGLTVIMGHTGNSMMLTARGMADLTEQYDTPNFNQNISKDLLKKIKSMISSKYGNPISDQFESELNTFYVLQRDKIEEFRGDEQMKGALTEWENDFLKIELFEGVPSYSAVLGKYGYSASEPLFSSTERKILIPDTSKDEKPCVTYVYIKYQLKEEMIEKLKLNNQKL